MKKFLLSIFAVMLAVFSVQAEEAVFNFADLYGTKTLSSVNAKTVDGITISYDKNSAQNAAAFNKDGTLRLYYGSNNGNSATFTAEAGKKITSVVVTASSTNYAPDVKYSVDGANAVKGTWSSTTLTISGIKASAVTIQNVGGAQLRTKVITVTYETVGGGTVEPEKPEAPAAPTLPTSCSFDNSMMVEITGIAADATVYYTTDESDPATSATRVGYTEPFEITATTTVKAVAVNEGGSSEVVSATYTKNEPVTPPAEGEVVDVLTSSDFTATTNEYKDFSGVTKESGAVYAGQSAKSTNGGIQLRSKNSNSGIVTTKSCGKVKSVTIKVESGTNKLDIYGKNTPYTAASDLYETSKQGTKLGTLSANGTLTIEGDYEYIGLRSNSGALYLTNVSITWDASAGVTPVAPNAPVLTESQSFSGSMTVTITSDATVYYTTDESDPATSATRVEYTKPFEITATTTVKAVAVNEVGESEVVEATYTYLEPIDLSNCTVAEAIEAYKNGQTGEATITGYIVGAADGALSKAQFTSETSVESNILIADNADEENVDNCMPIKLASGTVIRNALNLATNKNVYKKKITIKCELEAYFSVAGTQNVETAGLYWNVTDAGYATLYLGYKAEIPSTVKAHIVTKVNDGFVTLTQVEGVVAANTGLILEGEGEHIFNITSVATTAVVKDNLLEGTAAATEIDVEAYVLWNVDGEACFCKAKMTDGVWLNNANKAYLPASEVPTNVKSLSFRFGEGTTAIENVEVENKVKTIFDLTGRRVEAITAPGVYIVNGKKVLVK